MKAIGIDHSKVVIISNCQNYVLHYIKPNYASLRLKNESSDNSQIIIKRNEGITGYCMIGSFDQKENQKSFLSEKHLIDGLNQLGFTINSQMLKSLLS